MTGRASSRRSLHQRHVTEKKKKKDENSNFLHEHEITHNVNAFYILITYGQ